MNKTITLILAALAFFGILTPAAYAQSTPPQTIQIQAPGPRPVSLAGGGVVGATGGQTLYYWVNVRYASGVVIMPNPIAVFNTVGAANLSVSNYVNVSWAAVTGATGYDVIRSTTPLYPASPSCADCAIVLNTSSLTASDQSPTGSAYPPGGLNQASGVTGTLYIDNTTNSVPYVNMQLLYRSTENLIVGLISGAIANGDCLEYSNGRIVSAGAACGSGSSITFTESSTIDVTQTGNNYEFSVTSYVMNTDQYFSNSPTYASLGGTTSAYTLTTPITYPAPNTDGVCVYGKNVVGNSAVNATMDVNGAGNRPLYQNNGTSNAGALSTGGLRLNQNYRFCYAASLAASGAWVVTDTGGGGSTAYAIISKGIDDSRNPSDSTTYYTDGNTGLYISFDSNIVRFICPVSGTISAMYVSVYESSGAATSENSDITLRINGADTALTLAMPFTGSTSAAVSATGSVAVSAGDLVGFKIVTPAWATNPTGVRLHFSIRITL